MALCVIPFSFPGLPGVRAAFTTALCGAGRGNISRSAGGCAAAAGANREWLRGELGFSGWCCLRQVHGTDMAFDPPAVAAHEAATTVADGSATDLPGRALVIKTADCQPILLAHASGRYVAALHVGWRGNVLEFPQKGVAAFCARYGLDPAEVMAVRGPSLGPGASEFIHFASEFGEKFAPFYDAPSRTVHLWRLTASQLQEAGLKPAHIFGLDLCTASLAMFHSYRRDKAQAGRQASLIWMEAPGQARP